VNLKRGTSTHTSRRPREAFAGESQARNKYTYFAEAAREEGYHYIAKIFEETAENEKQHAKDHLRLLNQDRRTSQREVQETSGDG